MIEGLEVLLPAMRSFIVEKLTEDVRLMHVDGAMDMKLMLSFCPIAPAAEDIFEDLPWFRDQFPEGLIECRQFVSTYNFLEAA